MNEKVASYSLLTSTWIYGILAARAHVLCSPRRCTAVVYSFNLNQTYLFVYINGEQRYVSVMCTYNHSTVPVTSW